MKKNMGTADRTIRTLIALVIVVLLVTGQLSGWLAIVLGIVAAMFLLTSSIGWCPAYLPFGLSTCGKRSGPTA
jgi:hypothetical protein